MKKLLVSLVLLLAPSIAFGQAVLQGGPWQEGHLPQYVGQGQGVAVVQDGGPAGGGAIGVNPSELGITARGQGTPPFDAQGSGPLGTNFCDFDAPTDNAGGYHYLCISPNVNGNGLIAYGSGGGATPGGLRLNINGFEQGFGIVQLPIAAGDVICAQNTAGNLTSCGGGTFTGFANPSVSVGLTAKNGAATTAMRSDAAPALDQSISPTMTGVWTFSAGANAPFVGFPGSTSGTTVLQPASVASGTLILPPANDVLVGRSTTDTLTNKTIDGNNNTLPFTQDGTGAVTQSVNSKLKQFVWIKDFGAVCDGTTDDTTAIQNTWNAAASIGKDVYLGGVGASCKITGLTAPTPSAGASGNRSALVGEAMGATTLVTSTGGCAITIGATYGVNSDYNADFRDFSLVGLNATTGNGICLNNITGINFDRILISQFSNDILAGDSINVKCSFCRILTATVGINASFVSHSHPNNWTLTSPSVSGITTYGMIFNNPANLAIHNGDFEGNGTGNLSAAVIYINGNPIEGTFGADIQGNYFEGSTGIADILLSQNAGAQNGTHSIRSNVFNRTTNDLTNVVAINNNGTGKTTLSLESNGFFDAGTHVPAAGTQYVASLTATTTNWFITCSGNTATNADVEMTNGACRVNSDYTQKVYPEQFGGGTSVADNAPAIARAIASLPSTGGIVAFQCGDYAVGSTITIPTLVTIQGCGEGGGTILDFAGQTSSVGLLVNGGFMVKIRDLLIANTYSAGLQMNGIAQGAPANVGYAEVSNVRVQNNRNDSCYVFGTVYVSTIKDTDAFHCAAHGYDIRGPLTGDTFINGYAEGAVNDGWKITNAGYTNFIGLSSDSNGDYAYELINLNGVTFTSPGGESNQKGMFVLESSDAFASGATFPDIKGLVINGLLSFDNGLGAGFYSDVAEIAAVNSRSIDVTFVGGMDLTSPNGVSMLLSGFGTDVKFIGGTYLGTRTPASGALISGIGQVTIRTVAQLPTCNSTLEGTRYGVVDATATTFHTAVAGGGAQHVQVYCNSAAWVIGG